MIEIKNLYFSYSGVSPYILRDINLNIKDGEYISILGENGAGKSTLVKLILKLLKPTSGEININSQKIGYVPQRKDLSNSNFPITAYEMLNCYRKILKIKNSNAIDSVLDKVKMKNFKNSLIGNLSGGQCQKIFIARALIGNPDLLILDEPSTGIDINSQNEIYELISGLNKHNNVTVISIEHNLKAAIANSTLIYHVADHTGHLCSPDEYVNEYLTANGRSNIYASL